MEALFIYHSYAGLCVGQMSFTCYMTLVKKSWSPSEPFFPCCVFSTMSSIDQMLYSRLQMVMVWVLTMDGIRASQY